MNFGPPAAMMSRVTSSDFDPSSTLRVVQSRSHGKTSRLDVYNFNFGKVYNFIC